jgi:hypothetical protein
MDIMDFNEKKKVINNIKNKVDKISNDLDKMKIAEYVEMMEHPRRMLWANFLGGLARGFGVAMGFTLLGAILIYLLRAAVKLNLPIIGQFIAELVKIVQDNLEKYK